MFGQLLPNKNKNTTVYYGNLVIPSWGTKQGLCLDGKKKFV
jgi:hypothetical protein